MPQPADEGLFMPAEWAAHSRCWMAWPCRESLWGDGLDAARDAYAEVAKAIAAFEPVTMIANPDSLAEVSLRCGSGVACLPLAHDDSWLRDSGPTFLTDGGERLVGVDWRFNAWGEKYAPYDLDAALAEVLLAHLKVPRFAAPLVLEGGAIHVDGEGTAMATEQCLLNKNRNPDLSREQIEMYLRAYLGVETVIWLKEGLAEDETDGHIDNIACFVAPGRVLALTTSDPEDVNFPILQDNIARLRGARDAKGRDLEVIEIEQPRASFDAEGGRLALSYVNYYLANGGVVMPAFEDPNDDAAYEVVSGCFPDRNVVQVPALDILRGGGGIHCITQQQPAVGAGEA